MSEQLNVPTRPHRVGRVDCEFMEAPSLALQQPEGNEQSERGNDKQK